MPQIAPPATVNLKTVRWGSASGDRPHIGHYYSNLLPGGYHLQRLHSTDPEALTDTLTRLESHLATPDYFFPPVYTGLIAYRNFTDRRELVDPTQRRNGGRVLDLLTRAVGYLAEIQVGDTFVANVGNMQNLSWGRPQGWAQASFPYFGFDPLPSLVTREATNAINGPFAATLGSIAHITEDMGMYNHNQATVAGLTALQGWIGSLTAPRHR